MYLPGLLAEARASSLLVSLQNAKTTVRIPLDATAEAGIAHARQSANSTRHTHLLDKIDKQVEYKSVVGGANQASLPCCRNLDIIRV